MHESDTDRKYSTVDWLNLDQQTWPQYLQEYLNFNIFLREPDHNLIRPQSQTEAGKQILGYDELVETEPEYKKQTDKQQNKAHNFGKQKKKKQKSSYKATEYVHSTLYPDNELIKYSSLEIAQLSISMNKYFKKQQWVIAKKFNKTNSQNNKRKLSNLLIKNENIYEAENRDFKNYIQVQLTFSTDSNTDCLQSQVVIWFKIYEQENQKSQQYYYSNSEIQQMNVQDILAYQQSQPKSNFRVNRNIQNSDPIFTDQQILNIMLQDQPLANKDDMDKQQGYIKDYFSSFKKKESNEVKYEMTNYWNIDISLKVQMLDQILNQLLDTAVIRSEIDRREQGQLFQAGQGGRGGAFAMRTQQSSTLSPTAHNLRSGTRTGNAASQMEPPEMEVDYLEFGESGDGNTDQCVLCGVSGNLLCCDGCPASFHYKCLGVQSKDIPDGDWFCAECEVGGRGETAGLRIAPHLTRKSRGGQFEQLSVWIFQDSLVVSNIPTLRFHKNSRRRSRTRESSSNQIKFWQIFDHRTIYEVWQGLRPQRVDSMAHITSMHRIQQICDDVAFQLEQEQQMQQLQKEKEKEAQAFQKEREQVDRKYHKRLSNGIANAKVSNELQQNEQQDLNGDNIMSSAGRPQRSSVLREKPWQSIRRINRSTTKKQTQQENQENDLQVKLFQDQQQKQLNGKYQADGNNQQQNLTENQLKENGSFKIGSGQNGKIVQRKASKDLQIMDVDQQPVNQIYDDYDRLHQNDQLQQQHNQAFVNHIQVQILYQGVSLHFQYRADQSIQIGLYDNINLHLNILQEPDQFGMLQNKQEIRQFNQRNQDQQNQLHQELSQHEEVMSEKLQQASTHKVEDKVDQEMYDQIQDQNTKLEQEAAPKTKKQKQKEKELELLNMPPEYLDIQKVEDRRFLDECLSQYNNKYEHAWLQVSNVIDQMLRMNPKQRLEQDYGLYPYKELLLELPLSNFNYGSYEECCNTIASCGECTVCLRNMLKGYDHKARSQFKPRCLDSVDLEEIGLPKRNLELEFRQGILQIKNQIIGLEQKLISRMASEWIGQLDIFENKVRGYKEYGVRNTWLERVRKAQGVKQLAFLIKQLICNITDIQSILPLDWDPQVHLYHNKIKKKYQKQSQSYINYLQKQQNEYSKAKVPQNLELIFAEKQRQLLQQQQREQEEQQRKQAEQQISLDQAQQDTQQNISNIQQSENQNQQNFKSYMDLLDSEDENSEMDKEDSQKQNESVQIGNNLVQQQKSDSNIKQDDVIPTSLNGNLKTQKQFQKVDDNNQANTQGGNIMDDNVVVNVILSVLDDRICIQFVDLQKVMQQQTDQQQDIQELNEQSQIQLQEDAQQLTNDKIIPDAPQDGLNLQISNNDDQQIEENIELNDIHMEDKSTTQQQISQNHPNETETNLQEDLNMQSNNVPQFDFSKIVLVKNSNVEQSNLDSDQKDQYYDQQQEASKPVSQVSSPRRTRKSLRQKEQQQSNTKYSTRGSSRKSSNVRKQYNEDYLYGNLDVENDNQVQEASRKRNKNVQFADHVEILKGETPWDDDQIVRKVSLYQDKSQILNKVGYHQNLKSGFEIKEDEEFNYYNDTQEEQIYHVKGCYNYYYLKNKDYDQYVERKNPFSTLHFFKRNRKQYIQDIPHLPWEIVKRLARQTQISQIMFLRKREDSTDVVMPRKWRFISTLEACQTVAQLSLVMRDFIQLIDSSQKNQSKVQSSERESLSKVDQDIQILDRRVKAGNKEVEYLVVKQGVPQSKIRPPYLPLAQVVNKFDEAPRQYILDEDQYQSSQIINLPPNQDLYTNSGIKAITPVIAHPSDKEYHVQRILEQPLIVDFIYTPSLLKQYFVPSKASKDYYDSESSFAGSDSEFDDELRDRKRDTQKIAIWVHETQVPLKAIVSYEDIAKSREEQRRKRKQLEEKLRMEREREQAKILEAQLTQQEIEKKRAMQAQNRKMTLERRKMRIQQEREEQQMQQEQAKNQGKQRRRRGAKDNDNEQQEIQQDSRTQVPLISEDVEDATEPCKICGLLFQDDPDKDPDHWICCDSCSNWFHARACLQMTEEEFDYLTDEFTNVKWSCKECESFTNKRNTARKQKQQEQREKRLQQEQELLEKQNDQLDQQEHRNQENGIIQSSKKNQKRKRTQREMDNDFDDDDYQEKVGIITQQQEVPSKLVKRSTRKTQENSQRLKEEFSKLQQIILQMGRGSRALRNSVANVQHLLVMRIISEATIEYKAKEQTQIKNRNRKSTTKQSQKDQQKSGQEQQANDIIQDQEQKIARIYDINQNGAQQQLESDLTTPKPKKSDKKNSQARQRVSAAKQKNEGESQDLQSHQQLVDQQQVNGFIEEGQTKKSSTKKSQKSKQRKDKELLDQQQDQQQDAIKEATQRQKLISQLKSQPNQEIYNGDMEGLENGNINEALGRYFSITTNQRSNRPKKVLSRYLESPQECNLCKNIIQIQEIQLECSICQLHYHSQCQNITQPQHLQQFVCQICEQKTGQRSTFQSSEDLKLPEDQIIQDDILANGLQEKQRQQVTGEQQVQNQKRKSSKIKDNSNNLNGTLHKKVKQVIEDSMQQSFCQAFVGPVPKETPYYYQIIKQPMCFEIIWGKILKRNYKLVSKVIEDILLLFHNCSTFNQQGSQIMNLCKQTQDFIVNKWKEQELPGLNQLLEGISISNSQTNLSYNPTQQNLNFTEPQNVQENDKQELHNDKQYVLHQGHQTPKTTKNKKQLRANFEQKLQNQDILQLRQDQQAQPNLQNLQANSQNQISKQTKNGLFESEATTKSDSEQATIDTNDQLKDQQAQTQKSQLESRNKNQTPEKVQKVSGQKRQLDNAAAQEGQLPKKQRKQKQQEQQQALLDQIIQRKALIQQVQMEQDQTKQKYIQFQNLQPQQNSQQYSSQLELQLRNQQSLKEKIMQDLQAQQAQYEATLKTPITQTQNQNIKVLQSSQAQKQEKKQSQGQRKSKDKSPKGLQKSQKQNELQYQQYQLEQELLQQKYTWLQQDPRELQQALTMQQYMEQRGFSNMAQQQEQLGKIQQNIEDSEEATQTDSEQTTTSSDKQTTEQLSRKQGQSMIGQGIQTTINDPTKNSYQQLQQQQHYNMQNMIKENGIWPSKTQNNQGPNLGYEDMVQSLLKDNRLDKMQILKQMEAMKSTNQPQQNSRYMTTDQLKQLQNLQQFQKEKGMQEGDNQKQSSSSYLQMQMQKELQKEQQNLRLSQLKQQIQQQGTKPEKIQQQLSLLRQLESGSPNDASKNLNMQQMLKQIMAAPLPNSQISSKPQPQQSQSQLQQPDGYIEQTRQLNDKNLFSQGLLQNQSSQSKFNQFNQQQIQDQGLTSTQNVSKANQQEKLLQMQQTLKHLQNQQMNKDSGAVKQQGLGQTSRQDQNVSKAQRPQFQSPQHQPPQRWFQQSQPQVTSPSAISRNQHSQGQNYQQFTAQIPQQQPPLSSPLSQQTKTYSQNSKFGYGQQKDYKGKMRMEEQNLQSNSINNIQNKDFNQVDRNQHFLPLNQQRLMQERLNQQKQQGQAYSQQPFQNNYSGRPNQEQQYEEQQFNKLRYQNQQSNQQNTQLPQMYNQGTQNQMQAPKTNLQVDNAQTNQHQIFNQNKLLPNQGMGNQAFNLNQQQLQGDQAHTQKAPTKLRFKMKPQAQRESQDKANISSIQPQPQLQQPQSQFQQYQQADQQRSQAQIPQYSGSQISSQQYLQPSIQELPQQYTTQDQNYGNQQQHYQYQAKPQQSQMVRQLNINNSSLVQETQLNNFNAQLQQFSGQPNELPQVKSLAWRYKIGWILKAMEKVQSAEIFLTPVPREIPQYYNVIKKPMDFSTIRNKVMMNQYQDAGAVFSDVEQMWYNCKLYNGDKSPFTQMAMSTKKVFDNYWTQLSLPKNAL